MRQGAGWIPLLAVAANGWRLFLYPAEFRQRFLWEWVIVVGWLAILWAVVPARTASQTLPRLSRTAWVALCAVIAVGVLARTVMLDVYPSPEGNTVEETQTGGIAHRSLTQGLLDPDFPLTDLLGESGLHFFGRTMTGLRLPFVCWSCLGVPLFFVTARRFFRSEVTALVLTLLFACNTYVIATGRTAMETFAPVTTIMLALAALLRARACGTLLAYALAGAANGLLCVEYFSYRFIAAMLTLWMLAMLSQGEPEGRVILDARQPRWTALWRGRDYALMYLAVMATVALPCWIELSHVGWLNLVEGLNRNLVGQVLPAAERSSLTQVLGEGAQRVFRQAELLLFKGEVSLCVSSTRGIFDPVTSVLGLCAMVANIRRARVNPSRWWPALTTILAIVLAALLTTYIQRYRVYCTMPFFLLGIGIALDDLLARRRWPALTWSVITLLVALAGWNLWDFFGRTVYDPAVRSEAYSFPLLVAQEIKQQQDAAGGCPLFLVATDLWDDEGGDTGFLFDRARVRFVGSLAEVDRPGRVIACNTFGEQAAKAPGFQVIKRYEERPQREDTYVVADCR